MCVIRGDDLLASTGRQIQLARLLGRDEPPEFLHHALIMKSSDQKLSKSDGDTGVRELVCAAVAARFLEGQLFAVSPRDAGSYVVAAAAIGAAALAACWLPARRASAISPLEAIRAE